MEKTKSSNDLAAIFDLPFSLPLFIIPFFQRQCDIQNDRPKKR